MRGLTPSTRYSNIRSSSVYPDSNPENYIPSNLFDQVVDNGYPSLIDSSKYETYAYPAVYDVNGRAIYRPDWDFAAVGVDDVYVSFSLDALYTLNSFGFTTRIGNGGNIETDKPQSLSFWFSSTTAFRPEYPGYEPDATSGRIGTAVGYFREYDLPGAHEGQHVLMRFNPHGQQLGNLGGAEFRLSGGLVSIPEPSFALLLGFGGVALFYRRRK